MAIGTYKYRCQITWCEFLSTHIQPKEGNSKVHFPFYRKEW